MTPNSNTEEPLVRHIAELKRQVFEQERDHLISSSTATGKGILVYGLPLSKHDAERTRRTIRRRFFTYFFEIHLLFVALVVVFRALIFGFQFLLLPY